LTYASTVSSSELDMNIEPLLFLCEIGDWYDRREEIQDCSRILSLGEQHRVAFICILFLRLKWLFLDKKPSSVFLIWYFNINYHWTNIKQLWVKRVKEKLTCLILISFVATFWCHLYYRFACLKMPSFKLTSDSSIEFLLYSYLDYLFSWHLVT
jgi:hypothetical protein